MQTVTTNVGNPMKKNNFVGIVKIVKFFKKSKLMLPFIAYFKKFTGSPLLGLPRWHNGKRNYLPMREMQVRSLGRQDPLQNRMATHSGILAWEIPWTEEPGGLQSMGVTESATTE